MQWLIDSYIPFPLTTLSDSRLFRARGIISQETGKKNPLSYLTLTFEFVRIGTRFSSFGHVVCSFASFILHDLKISVQFIVAYGWYSSLRYQDHRDWALHKRRIHYIPKCHIKWSSSFPCFRFNKNKCLILIHFSIYIYWKLMKYVSGMYKITNNNNKNALF